MGSRKRNSAEKIKDAKKDLAFAKLNNCPTSPRKMRLVADQIRGEDISNALSILKFSPKEASRRLEKLLVSAISNWQSKNEDSNIDAAQLFVKEIRWGKQVIVRNNAGGPINADYYIVARRLDDDLIVEYEGESHEDYPGGNEGYSFNFEHNYVEGLIRDMVNEKVEQIEEEN